MKLPFALALSVISSPLWASTVTTGCFPGTQVSTNAGNTSPFSYSSCNTADIGTGAHASALAQAVFTPASTGGGYNTLHIEQYAYAQYGYFGGNATGSHITSQASAALDYADTFLTNGPVRSGYLQIDLFLNGGVSIYSGGEKLNVILSPAPGNVPPPDVTCSTGQGCYVPSFWYRSLLVPYTLGGAITLSAEGSIFADADFNAGQSGGQDFIDYRFRFFEADGVTPVSISESPEPATLGLLGASLLGLWIVKRRAKN